MSGFWRLLLILLSTVPFWQNRTVGAEDRAHDEFVQLCEDLDKEVQQRFD
ncbi:hypothetical protein CA13_10750 [Planctomycetes bacterium CA13]|uniref:Uncharacterized protein n=1 Tax=Novipirellula herctigrandis TaxID=2527986 RepID=A0A5C5YX83_9BACT|nr:hypothetical protein CA13_10750 [Planctomycetes bacterium CA13]